MRALLVACLLASCGGQPPEPRESSSRPPAFPDDHPPLAGTGTPLPRLADDAILATVGDEAITAGDLDAAIGSMPAADRHEYTSPEMVRDLMESLIDRKLMAAAARAEGADGGSTDQMLAAGWLDRQLAAIPAPTEADITAYYRENSSEFRAPARVLVTRATVATEPAAEGLRRELADGATAGELGGRVAGGVFSASQLWLQDGQKIPETTTVALALGKGEVSRVITVPDGFLVMRADRVEPAGPRPLAEVSPGIRAHLHDVRRRAAADALRERLRNGARVRVDEGALMSYRPPVQAGL